MSTFVKGGSTTTPFGRNEFLRSTQDVKVESYTVAASTIPSQTIDGVANQKILQPGTIMAAITSGPDAGKVGPYQVAGTKEVQTLTKAGTVSGGTFTLSFGGQTTSAIPWNANAAAVQAALVALSTIGTAGVTVTGGDFSGATPFTVTFNLNGDQALLVAGTASLTGAGAGITVAQQTQGVAGANDGRQTLANVVGINQTFLPWQTIERDVEIGVVYQCTAVQAWCIELDAASASIALTNTTAAGLVAQKRLNVNFV